MPEQKNWKDLALKILIPVLLTFISWMAIDIRGTGSETVLEVKLLKEQLREINLSLYRKGWIDSLQTEDIKILQGEHGIK